MSYIEQILENNICTATYLSSLKPPKPDEQDIRDTAGEATMKT